LAGDVIVILYLFVSVLEDKEPEIVCQFVVGDIVAVS
jgi:hypothetical protein